MSNSEEKRYSISPVRSFKLHLAAFVFTAIPAALIILANTIDTEFSNTSISRFGFPLYVVLMTLPYCIVHLVTVRIGTPSDWSVLIFKYQSPVTAVLRMFMFSSMSIVMLLMYLHVYQQDVTLARWIQGFWVFAFIVNAIIWSRMRIYKSKLRS